MVPVVVPVVSADIIHSTHMHVLTLLISLFVVQPLAEYGLHRLVHRLYVNYHIDHHTSWSFGTYWAYRGDWIVRGTVLTMALLQWYTAALLLLKYEVIHTLVHRLPGFRVLHRHHFLHHRDPTCNFSFSATWPDRLFGTLQE